MSANTPATLPAGSGSRSRTDTDTDTDGKKSTNTPNPTRCISNILPANLEDSPASGRGRYATVGVLEPVIRIERSAVDSADKAAYRIIASFVLEATIVGFDQSFQKHNRFFDSISLRFLFCRGDLVHPRPQSDAAVHGLQVTQERDKSTSVDAGVTAGVVSVAAPQISVQAQRNFKLAYQRTMSSWRMGLSFVEYPSRDTAPPLSSLLAGYLIPESQQLLPRTRENMMRQPPQELQQPFFQADSPHAPECRCRHPLVSPSADCRRWYDRAALWSWQTEASLRLWTPEIYGAFRCPITVMREVPVDTIDAIPYDKDQALLPYLQFDFEIDVRLRVLGLGWATLLTDSFRRTSSQPAEERLQSDTGQPLPPDHVQFRISCCPENISWPLYPTRNLQEEAELGTFGPGRVAHRLQTNREFGAALSKTKAATPVTRTASSASPRYEADPLALPAIVPVTWARRPTHNGTLNQAIAEGGDVCCCQSLRPTQNRLYHCCIDCDAGHAFTPTRRDPIFKQTKSLPSSPILSKSPQSFASPTPSIASRRSPVQASPRPQFRKRTSMEKMLLQEKKRR
ncbi:hypothetical protein F503_05976 [Ophiostoma piceae UAMH 11346]|uniref:Uncharacterized protein n=1 Tax=Ophiostoma piceae (strain UAMH 11346) TaxID=1262450 RepID=S3CFH5_OPHP1|nr:hypothetical protein F503_05976 [Ophiostoma piceae UAMH 11346]